MKTSTIVLASIIATGLLAAFILPLTLMLLTKSGQQPIDLSAAPVTTQTSPFRNLIIERTDSTRLWVALNLSVMASDSLAVPSITTNEGWARWLTLDHTADTLRMTISVPDNPKGYNPGYCDISGTIRIPTGMLHIISSNNILNNLTLNNASQTSLTLDSPANFRFNNCDIDTIAMSPEQHRIGINLDASRVRMLTCGLREHNGDSHIACSNGASIATLEIDAQASGSYHFSNANIGSIRLNSGNPECRINLIGLTPDTTIASHTD